MFENALVVGNGSIAKDVYIPELLNLGYFVDVLDPFGVEGVTYRNINFIPEDMEYDVIIICSPNHTHLETARYLTEFSDKILIEKPGVGSSDEWQRLINQFPLHNISLVKNNLYRDLPSVDLSEVTAIDINWLNNNRVPSPGSWFTNKALAFGGVSHDLLPHLYCMMHKLIGFDNFKDVTPVVTQEQRWDLSTVGSTDYGLIDKNGVYDVCDYAQAIYDVGVPVTLTASWKEGYNDIGIHIYYKDGTKETIELDLCPGSAYAAMIESDERHPEFDLWIHQHLELFNE